MLKELFFIKCLVEDLENITDLSARERNPHLLRDLTAQKQNKSNALLSNRLDSDLRLNIVPGFTQRLLTQSFSTTNLSFCSEALTQAMAYLTSLRETTRFCILTVGRYLKLRLAHVERDSKFGYRPSPIIAFCLVMVLIRILCFV